MDTQQTPIRTGFGPETTAAEVMGDQDLTGKVAIVTGGYSGIGLETTRVLAGAGATVIVPARRESVARDALAGIKNVEVAEMDLSDPVSIDKFAAEFLRTGRLLHIVVNSAGIMAPPLMRDARGYEIQFSVNHLGHYQLIARVLPALVDAHGARIVAVSSAAHRFGQVDFDDPNFERRAYDRMVAYGQSKTANALFAVAADIIGEPYGVRVFSCHPGVINTNLGRHLTPEDIAAMSARRAPGATQMTFKTVEQGAATSVWCAVSPQLNRMGGVYCEDVNIAAKASADSDQSGGVRPWAMDPESADRLWWLSRQLSGVHFPL